MNKISGLVLDYYDDRDGDVLKSVFPTRDSVPEVIKQAHSLSYEERQKIPEDAFALVMVEDGQVLRKFATADGGNTALSVEYFLRTGHKLPLEAQKTAAANLVDACHCYGLEPPDSLVKVAIGALGLLSGALTIPGAVQEAKQNLRATRGTEGAIMTPQQIQARKMQMGAGQ